MIHKLCVVGPGTVFLHSQCHPADHRIGCFRCFLCDLVGIGPELQSHSQNHDKTSKQQCHSAVHQHSLPQEDHSACDQRYNHCDLPCACQYCHTGRKQRHRVCRRFPWMLPPISGKPVPGFPYRSSWNPYKTRQSSPTSEAEIQRQAGSEISKEVSPFRSAR